MSNRRGPETWARGPSIAEQCWHEPTPPAELDAMAARIILGRVARGLYTPRKGASELARLGLAHVADAASPGRPLALELLALRERRGWTWAHLEQLTGVGQSHIWRIAHGETRPKPATVARIRAALQREAA